MLLTTEGVWFPVFIYSIGITNEAFCVFTVRYELKLYLVFMLIFISNGFISCVYDTTLRVSIGHIIFRCNFKVVVYSVTYRLMTQRKLKITCTYV